MKPIGTREIRTVRLLLRRLEMADVEILHERGSLVGDLGEARRQVREMLAEYRKPLCFHWVLEYEGKPIGRIRAWDIDPFHDHCQLGYDLAPAYRGRGFMTEAMRAVLAYLFNEADLHRVYCRIREGNGASVRVCEACGMTFEGVMREHYKSGERFENVRVYGIVKSRSRQSE